MDTTALRRNNLAGVLSSLSVDDMTWAMKFLADKLSSQLKDATSSNKMSELDKAILDVENGNVHNFDTLQDMMAYLEA